MTASLQPESKSPSRRALLAGALGGIGAWAASAIGRASPVRAEGEAMVVGGDYTAATSTTSLYDGTNDQTVLSAASAGAGTGVYGESQSGIGIWGKCISSYGVYGQSDSNRGVYGESNSSWGVYGSSNSSVGVYGNSGSSAAVHGQGGATDQPAIVGQSNGNSTGVLGVSGVGALPAAKAKTGVYGYANQDSSAKGVYGESPTGWAGYFAGRVYTTKYHEMQEISAPAAPAANHARLFVRDNGGKTQLCVRFNTGGVLVIKTQP